MHCTIPIAYFTLMEAVQNRLLWLLAAALISAFAITEFIGEVAVTETRQIQAAFLAAGARFFSVFVVSLFVITSVVREFNDKGLELILSLPITRASYFFGKLAGFSILALVVAASCTLVVWLYAPLDQAAIWGGSLFFELLIVIAVSLLCLFTFSHVTLALSVVMAFYVLSRAIGAIQLIGSGPLADTSTVSQQLINAFIDLLAYVLPELHNFTLSEWVIYETANASVLIPLAGQTLVYVAFISGAALFDLYRKNL